MADRGHRELAFLGADSGGVTMVQRELGYREACLRRGLTASTAPDRIVPCGRDLASGVRFAAELLDSPTPPTAFVCVSDPLAAGAVIALQARGLAPGRDAAVIGYDDTPLTSFGTVGITSVRQPSAQIAAELVRLVIDRPEDPEHLLLRPELAVRSSTDPGA
jgi:LacI family transcriptional regulator